MARPYELYVRFLVTRGIDELEAVNGRLAELHLQPIDEAYLDRQYNLVQDLVPEPVLRQIETQKYEGTFLKWMKILEVEELWLLEKPFKTQESAASKLVYDINFDPQLRTALSSLLIKNMVVGDICMSINAKFSYMLKEAHVSLYRKFFWEPNRMTRASWRQYLRGCDEREKAVLFTALTEPLEVVKTTLDLPAQANVSDTLQYLFTHASMKAKHYLRLNTPDSNREARSWISQTMALADKYEKHRTGNVDDFGKSLQMEFDYIDSEYPTPDEALLKDLKNRQEELEKKGE
jgi:hypothetical protein